MRMSTIFRHAARMIEGYVTTYSCTAVSHAARHKGLPFDGPGSPRAEYQRLMSPHGCGRLFVSDFELSARYIKESRKARNHRVLALCMAATLADEEGL